MTLFAIKVSSTWLFAAPSPVPAIIAMPSRAWHWKHNVVVGDGGVLQRVADRAANFQIDTQQTGRRRCRRWCCR